MKYLLLLLGMLAPLSLSAFSPIVTELEEPYDVVTIENQRGVPEQYLGELQNYPVMYEVTSEEPFELQVNVQQLKSGQEPIPFSLIAIRKNDRGGGVTEIGRLSLKVDAWTVQKNAQLGLSLWQSEVFSRQVDAGTYRVEISTPTNQGKYLITFGVGEDTDGYFQSVQGVRTTQQFFGFSVLKLLTSSLIYYPLGVVFVLFVLQRIWRYRKLILKREEELTK